MRPDRTIDQVKFDYGDKIYFDYLRNADHPYIDNIIGTIKNMYQCINGSKYILVELTKKNNCPVNHLESFFVGYILAGSFGVDKKGGSS